MPLTHIIKLEIYKKIYFYEYKNLTRVSTQRLQSYGSKIMSRLSIRP